MAHAVSCVGAPSAWSQLHTSHGCHMPSGRHRPTVDTPRTTETISDCISIRHTASQKHRNLGPRALVKQACVRLSATRFRSLTFSSRHCMYMPPCTAAPRESRSSRRRGTILDLTYPERGRRLRPSIRVLIMPSADHTFPLSGILRQVLGPARRHAYTTAIQEAKRTRVEARGGVPCHREQQRGLFLDGEQCSLRWERATPKEILAANWRKERDANCSPSPVIWYE